MSSSLGAAPIRALSPLWRWHVVTGFVFVAAVSFVYDELTHGYLPSLPSSVVGAVEMAVRIVALLSAALGVGLISIELMARLGSVPIALCKTIHGAAILGKNRATPDNSKVRFSLALDSPQPKVFITDVTLLSRFNVGDLVDVVTFGHCVTSVRPSSANGPSGGYRVECPGSRAQWVSLLLVAGGAAFAGANLLPLFTGQDLLRFRSEQLTHVEPISGATAVLWNAPAVVVGLGLLGYVLWTWRDGWITDNSLLTEV